MDLKHESERLAALHSYRILDTAPDPALDRITRLLTRMFDVPIALVSLVDDHRQWFKSRVGVDVSETPREIAFCAHAICGDDLFEVPDAHEDPRFANNPLVTELPNVRFYCGVPLRDADGYNLGTLNVIDNKPRQIDDTQRALLRDLGKIVVDRLEVHRDAQRARDVADEAKRYRQRTQQLELAESVAGIGHWMIDLVNQELFWSSEIYKIHGVTPETYTPELETAIDFYHPDDRASVQEAVDKAIAGKEPFEFTFRLVRPGGEIREVHSKARLALGEDGEVTSVFGVFQDVTDSRKQERLLREATERYDAAICGASVGIWDWEPESRTLFWSQRFLDLLAIGDESFQPSHEEFVRRLHPDDHDRVVAAVANHFGRQTPLTVEFRMLRDDGRYVWLETRGQAVWSEDGKPLRMSGSVNVIDERKRNDRFRDALNRLLTDKQLDWTVKISGLLGLGIDYLDLDVGIVARVQDDCYVVEHVAGTREALRAGHQYGLARTHCRATLNGGAVHAFGSDALGSESFSDVHEHLRANAYVGAPLIINGEVYGTVSFAARSGQHEIADQREQSFVALLTQWIAYEIGNQISLQRLVDSRDALQFKQEELDLIFNVVPARIWFKDDENTILRLNRRAAESMGVTVAEAEGANTYDLFPEMAGKYHADDLRVINSQTPSLGIIERYSPADGEQGWVRTDKLPLVDAASGQRRLLVVSQDITALMNAQRELEAQANELRRSNQDLDEFARIASHDLRAPMRGIENLASWIQEDLGDDIPPETLEKLELLRTRTMRMDRMLTDILAYSRAGRHEEQVERINLQAMVSEVVDWIRPTKPFEFEIPDDLPVLRTGRTSVQQVFLNLISNAAKHHDRDDGVVTLSYKRDEETLYFCVSDDGPGIPEQYRKRVFGMFQTLKRRDDVEGSGVGLPIVKKIVEALGGSIWVDGSTGSHRGTAMHFTLPSRLLAGSRQCNETRERERQSDPLVAG